jgi:hypothetical protein
VEHLIQCNEIRRDGIERATFSSEIEQSLRVTPGQAGCA